MKKKLVVCLLIGCMVLGTAACGSSKTEDKKTETTDQTDSEETEIDMSALGTSTIDELGNYKGVAYTPIDTTVTEEDVEQQVQYLLNINMSYEEVTDHDVVTETDIVKIDYVGTKDGVAFDGGSAEGYELDIANSTFIDGFAEGLVGVKVGDTVDLNLTFPEDYHSEELAGQDVVFAVTVNSIVQYVTPELNDEFAVENGYESVADMYEKVEAELLEDNETSAQKTQLQEIVEKIIADSTFTLTDEEIELYKTNLMTNQENQLAMYGMDLESYVSMYGFTMDEYEELMLEEGKFNLQVWLVEQAIAKAEGMEVTEEEHQSFVEEYAAYYYYEDTAEFEEAYGSENIDNNILAEKALAFVLENAVAAEE